MRFCRSTLGVPNATTGAHFDLYLAKLGELTDFIMRKLLCPGTS
jgi:hypothetical protein